MASPPQALPLHLLHLVALQALSHAGFSSSSLAASHALTDVLAHLLTLLAASAGAHADHAGRTRVGLLDGVQAVGELGLGVEELLEQGRADVDEQQELDELEQQHEKLLAGGDGKQPPVSGPLEDEHAPPDKGQSGLDVFRRYLLDGLDTDRSDAQRLVYRTPTEEEVAAYLARERVLAGSDDESAADDESSDDEAAIRSPRAEGALPTSPVRSALPPPPLLAPEIAALLADAAEEEDDWARLPFGKAMAHLPALPPPASMPAGLTGTETGLGTAAPTPAAETPAVPGVDRGGAGDDPALAGSSSSDASGGPSFLRRTPFARSQLSDAPLSLPSGPDALTAHAAPAMAHSSTLPQLIRAHAALSAAIKADPSSVLAGGSAGAAAAPGGKNVKRLRAAYHLSFQSAPPEAFSPSPSLFASLPVPAPRTTAIVPRLPPAEAHITLPPPVAFDRQRPVLGAPAGGALVPEGAHRHPQALASVLHYVAPAPLVRRTQRLADPPALVDKATGQELRYGPAWEGKEVVIETSGGAIIRHRIQKSAWAIKAASRGKGKGRGYKAHKHGNGPVPSKAAAAAAAAAQGKKKAPTASDEEFEHALGDAPPPPDDGAGVGGDGAGGEEADAGVEWEEEQEEIVVETKEVPVEYRATWDAPVRHYRDAELPFERRKRAKV